MKYAPVYPRPSLPEGNGLKWVEVCVDWAGPEWWLIQEDGNVLETDPEEYPGEVFAKVMGWDADYLVGEFDAPEQNGEVNGGRTWEYRFGNEVSEAGVGVFLTQLVATIEQAMDICELKCKNEE